MAVPSFRLSGTSLSLTYSAPFQEELSVRTEAISFVSHRWQPMPLWRDTFLHQSHFNPGYRVLIKSHCLEGTLEPQAEWPLHTLNSIKA